MFMQRRNEDEEQQKLHFQSWESYWGRPGKGCSRKTTLILSFIFLKEFVTFMFKSETIYSDNQKQWIREMTLY